MFKKFFNSVNNFIFSLDLINYHLGGIKKYIEEISYLHSSIFYVVEFQYEDCTSKSDLLPTLKAVNDFIACVVLVRPPKSIRILKNFDDGR